MYFQLYILFKNDFFIKKFLNLKAYFSLDNKANDLLVFYQLFKKSNSSNKSFLFFKAIIKKLIF